MDSISSGRANLKIRREPLSSGAGRGLPFDLSTISANVPISCSRRAEHEQLIVLQLSSVRGDRDSDSPRRNAQRASALASKYLHTSVARKRASV
jgi:hypothetical protein